MTINKKINAEIVLSGLKDFQKRTVNYVFDRLYGDVDPTKRFLVADEVGLGKTLVAKGIIAKTIEHLYDDIDRIDIIYVCSNAAIANQNINRLNISGDQNFELATRLTMLPIHVDNLTKNKINFISFTPNTTFKLQSRGGRREERLVIYKMLEGADWNVKQGLRNMLQGAVKTKERWIEMINWEIDDPDEGISSKYKERINSNKELVQELSNCCYKFQRFKENWPEEDSDERYHLIGKLRTELAHTCIDALQPDLVILDEFQRFSDLLKGDSDASLLAKKMFEYKEVRTLLLSATPYKMLSLNYENDGNHYKDFLDTMEFLFDGNLCMINELKKNLKEFGDHLENLNSDGHEQLKIVREILQDLLLKVMCRTERVGLTRKLDAMLKDKPIEAKIQTIDLDHAKKVDSVAEIVGARDTTEYWKSSPYLLNFLRNYNFRDKIDEASKKLPDGLVKALREANNYSLKEKEIEKYKKIDPANARMRVLFNETFKEDMGNLLWLPPSLPYIKPSGVFSNLNDLTKRLVFSKWNVVPDAIAAICSYEAERQMIGRKNVTHSTLIQKASQLLSITNNNNRPSGMPTIALMLPLTVLAKKIDPLEIAIYDGKNKPVSQKRMLRIAESKCRELLKCLPRGISGSRADQRWYWAAPAMLEYYHKSGVIDWTELTDGWVGSDIKSGQSKILEDHLKLLRDVVQQEYKLAKPLGPKPSDLARTLAEISLGAPGTCALRTLYRIAPELKKDSHGVLSAANRIADGFRTLYNQPQSIALLQGGRKESYWKNTLHYGIDGNIQALLDEQIHVLVEQLGLSNSDAGDRVKAISEHLAESMSIHTAQIKIDELKTRKNSFNFSNFNSRCHFALRFSEIKDDQDSTLSRIEIVRDAFNSPFRPFILASTSVGQEGLDFHTWCHAVVHWNLPTNPVDLEQREGRVHRFKGHAVRKNVARDIGLAGLSEWNGGDPWTLLFDLAKKKRPKGSSDLIPYWIYESDSDKNSAWIERRVPMLPLSREENQLVQLKKNLALYRLVFGQPRQEELLAKISEIVEDSEVEKIASTLHISLLPPD